MKDTVTRYLALTLGVVLLSVFVIGAEIMGQAGSEKSNLGPTEAVPNTTAVVADKVPADPVISPPQVGDPATPQESVKPVGTVPQSTQWKPGDPVRVRQDMKASDKPEEQQK